MRGLVAPLERKTSWQLAELVQDRTLDRMQRLLYRVPWDAEAARDRLEQFVSERFGDPDGIGVLDETGIPKKGTRAVGVAKHSGGAVGKLENCQVATLLTDAAHLRQRPRPRRLGPPLVPPGGLVRRPRPAHPGPGAADGALPDQAAAGQARAMLEHAWELGVPMRWVTGDSVYGDSVYGESTPVRVAIERAGTGYVLAVTSVTRVWQERPALLAPGGARPVRPSPRRWRRSWRSCRGSAGADGASGWEPKAHGSTTGGVCA